MGNYHSSVRYHAAQLQAAARSRAEAERKEEARLINERLRMKLQTCPPAGQPYRRGARQPIHRRVSSDQSSQVRLSEVQRIKAKLKQRDIASSIAHAISRVSRRAVLPSRWSRAVPAPPRPLLSDGGSSGDGNDDGGLVHAKHVQMTTDGSSPSRSVASTVTAGSPFSTATTCSPASTDASSNPQSPSSPAVDGARIDLLISAVDTPASTQSSRRLHSRTPPPSPNVDSTAAEQHAAHIPHHILHYSLHRSRRHSPAKSPERHSAGRVLSGHAAVHVSPSLLAAQAAGRLSRALLLPARWYADDGWWADPPTERLPSPVVV